MFVCNSKLKKDERIKENDSTPHRNIHWLAKTPLRSKNAGENGT